MKNNSTWILLCLACMMALSCSDKKNTTDESEKGVSTVLPDAKNEVAFQILKKRDFHHELVSNGKISARGKADLRFETGEVIAHIYVKNGDRVQKGQKLADLDKFRLEQKLSQSEDALLKAELELKDVLIGQGYSPDDFSKVPAETMKIAKVKSGYEQSKSQYELAKREMEHATLIAPFDGVVANLFSKPYNPANTAEAFCTIIDSKGMEADFTVLENELAFIRMGDKVVITPYAGGDAFEGSVSEINPLVGCQRHGESESIGKCGRKTVQRNECKGKCPPFAGRAAGYSEECRCIAFRQTSGIYPERRQGNVELCEYGTGECDRMCRLRQVAERH